MNTFAVKIVRTVLAISLPCLLLSGCWDRLEIEERAVVLGLSIDVRQGDGENEEEITHSNEFPVPKQQQIHLAAQIALPGRIPLGPGESGGGNGGSGTRRTVWVIEVDGYSIDDAIMNLQQQIASRLFFGHLRVIVVSEDIARRGLDNLNDYLRRNPEVRRTAWMMVSKGKALDLMQTAPKLERVPTIYLHSTLDEAVRMGKFPTGFIGVFWSNSVKKGQEGFLPYVDVKKEDNVELQGLAYFKGSRMVGRSSPLQIAAYLAIKGENPAGYRTFINVGEDSAETLMVYAARRKSDLDVDIRDGQPHFKLKVYLEINLEEKVGESISISNADILKKIEKVDAAGADKFYIDFINHTQKFGSDVCGFGEFVRAKYPGYWNTHVRTKEQWQRMYPDIKIEVSTKTYFRRIGMKAK